MDINNCVNGMCSLKESATEDKKTYFELVGIIQEAGKENHNGLIYPKPILDSAMKEYQINYIDRGLSYLELDHPEERDLENLAKEVVGILTKWWWEGNNLMANIRISNNTVNGQVVKSIYDMGGKIGISSRGIGDTEGNEVIELELGSFDLVAQPSVRIAVLDKLIESIQKKRNYTDINKFINNILNRY